MASLLQRYAKLILGVISCFDRIILAGMVREFSYAKGVEAFLAKRKVLIKQFPQWALPYRDLIRHNAERLATENHLAIDFIRRSRSFRKEARIKEVLAKRGEHPGLVWIFSAMEECIQYSPRGDRTQNRLALKREKGKCLHYYFYFIDEEFGLCYLRVPTWFPFRLQFYCNGHSWLAERMRRRRIAHTKQDNAFVEIGNFKAAQKLADRFPVDALHRKLKKLSRTYCPALEKLGLPCYWTVEQVEYSTDVVFRQSADLQPIYQRLIRALVLAVKAANIATFLGKQPHSTFKGEIGTRLDEKPLGTRVRHTMGMASLKLYDKLGAILRIETTTYDIRFFRQYRKVATKDGKTVERWAPMKKSMYSLGPFQKVAGDANRRYLEFLGTLDDPTAGALKLQRVSTTTIEEGRAYRGMNFFLQADLDLLETIARGEFAVSGFQNADLRCRLRKTSAQISRMVKRLRVLGLAKKVGGRYKYYLTHLGKQVTAAGLRLRHEYLERALGGLVPQEL